MKFNLKKNEKRIRTRPLSFAGETFNKMLPNIEIKCFENRNNAAYVYDIMV